MYDAGLMLWEEFHRPGAARAFRVVRPDELQGEFWFELELAEGATMLRHTVEGRAVGKYEAIWCERIEPLHDLILEASSTTSKPQSYPATEPIVIFDESALSLTPNVRRTWAPRRAADAGASAQQQYLAAGLVDEFELHLVPVLLGTASGCSRTSATSRSSRCARSRRPGSPTSSTASSRTAEAAPLKRASQQGLRSFQ